MRPVKYWEKEEWKRSYFGSRYGVEYSDNAVHQAVKTPDGVGVQLMDRKRFCLVHAKELMTFQKKKLLVNQAQNINFY